jgi:hypothetical protein
MTELEKDIREFDLHAPYSPEKVLCPVSGAIAGGYKPR